MKLCPRKNSSYDLGRISNNIIDLFVFFLAVTIITLNNLFTLLVPDLANSEYSYYLLASSLLSIKLPVFVISNFSGVFY